MHPISTHKRIRVVLALAMFVALSAALLDFRDQMPARVGHLLASVQFVPAGMSLLTGAGVSGLAFVGLLLLTLLFGRVYCSVICPLGIFQDLVSRVAAWFKRRKKALPFTKPLTLWRQGFLFAALAGIAVGWAGFALALLDPYSNYGRIASAIFRPLITLANNAVVGLASSVGIDSLYRVVLPWPGIGALAFPALMLSVVVFLSATKGRLYCNSVCPVGTLLGWVSQFAAFRIVIDKDKCTKCAACFRACKAQCIDLKNSAIDFNRCVACYNCISVCDDHGIGYRFMWGKKKEVPQEKKAEVGEVADPARRALLGRSVSALALGACLPSLSRAQEAKSESVQPPAGTRRRVGISPPGSLSVERFLDRCTACHLCVSACPSHVLQPSLFEYGLAGVMKPHMDFSAAFCDFDCVRCAEVCPDGAITLLPVEEKHRVQIGVAHFHKEKCIVYDKKTDCAACSEHCPTKAVYTVPFGENLRLPEVKEELCVGCGACQYACPVKPDKAITVTGQPIHRRAELRHDKPVQKDSKATTDFPF